MSNLNKIAGVCVDDTELAPLAVTLSESLNLRLIHQSPENLPADQFVLKFTSKGLGLFFCGRGVPGPIIIDFTSGTSLHRHRFGGGKGQLIAKAVGVKGSFRPHVLDVTAGLGQDAFVLASLGCKLFLVERSPVVFSLLQDGLSRGVSAAEGEVLESLNRMQLFHQDGLNFLKQMNNPVDVIYLDPMFPDKAKSAKSKKSMQAFQDLLDGDLDAGELLNLAISKAVYRVVVKRPRLAPALHEQFGDLRLQKPSQVLSGKSCRFDIYALRKLPV